MLSGSYWDSSESASFWYYFRSRRCAFVASNEFRCHHEWNYGRRCAGKSIRLLNASFALPVATIDKGMQHRERIQDEENVWPDGIRWKHQDSGYSDRGHVQIPTSAVASVVDEALGRVDEEHALQHADGWEGFNLRRCRPTPRPSPRSCARGARNGGGIIPPFISVSISITIAITITIKPSPLSRFSPRLLDASGHDTPRKRGM
ncbi:hypothetical protein BJV78DRAFT_1158385 [Lactifluus subvellereus]|nr:hypothetical protein BJV78DRAFT_1158385 [Lactifluus subvellereus]